MKVNFLQLLHESHTIDEIMEKQVQNLPLEELRWKPSPKEWGAIEILGHLNLTYDLYMPRLEKAYAEASPRVEVRDTVTIRTSRGWMIKSVAPRGTKRPFKMKTFSFFDPEVSAEEVREVLQQYLMYRTDFNAYLRAAREKDIDLMSVQSALKQVNFRVPEALKFLLSHEQRHIVQLRDVLEAIPTHV